jgi:hypothetical protein
MTKKNLALMVATLLFVLSLSFAAKVKYSTTGSVSGASFITYTGVNNVTIPAPPAPPAFVQKAFGTLNIKCTTSSCNSMVGASLTVTIHETLPGNGSGTVTTASLVGVFTSSGGSIGIDWNGPVTITTSVGGMTYQTTYDPVDLFKVCASGTCNVHLMVDVSQQSFVPEPDAALLLRLGMLGLMGLVIVTRKMISA